MLRPRSLALCPCLVLMAAAAVPARAIEPADVEEQLRRLRIATDRAAKVHNVTLGAGLATVVLTDGFVIPATPIAGRAVEFVFIGDGRIELEPPDEIEAGQLELFTGATALDERFNEAVFVIALDAAADALAGLGPLADERTATRAADLYRSWLTSPERRLLDVEARIFADAVGDRLAAGFFCGYLEGADLGEFLYVVDPLADEQVTLGRFVRPDLSRRDAKRVRRDLERAHRRGKLIGLEVTDLGTWDTWVSSTLTGPDGQRRRGTRGVEPEHYELDIALRGDELAMDGSAKVVLRPVVDGLRTVSFEMSSGLAPRGVVDGRGRPLDFLRSRNELVVVLAEPAGSGDELEITIGYTGRPIDKVAGGAFVQRSTLGWYPHAGSVDRATYTVTVHRPDRLDIVAPGTLEDGGAGADGLAWNRWRLDEPSVGFSFEVGRYEVATGRAGDVEISVAVDRLGQKVERDLAGEILATAIDVMEYYTEIYGPYPLDRLQVVSSPRGFSQGLMGFVSLSTAAMVDWDVWGEMLGVQDRRSVIAHEVAHQWWGNLVGWRSYRDQWISEAMATYSASIWAKNRLGPGDSLSRWTGPTSGWQRELLRETDDGRTIESLGPLVLGDRLDSSVSRSAYRAIVYKKGAVVLNTLSRLFEDGAYLEMLGRIVETAAGGVLSTDDFLRLIELFGATELEWFRRQFVDGTGLPNVNYSYSIEALDSGRWAVVGEARQRSPIEPRYAVVEAASGGLDLRTRWVKRIDPAESRLVVGFRIGLADRPGSTEATRRLLTGSGVLSGEVSPFRFVVDEQPAVLWFDPNEEVFGRFLADDHWPKAAAFNSGLALVVAGDIDGGKALMQASLEAEIARIPLGWRDYFPMFDAEREANRANARTHLALASIQLDAGRMGGAERELQDAENLIRGDDRWALARDLLVVESRLRLLSGQTKRAYRQLKKGVLGDRAIRSPATWALLAIAARAEGDTELALRAAERAKELNVDLGPLTVPD